MTTTRPGRKSDGDLESFFGFLLGGESPSERAAKARRVSFDVAGDWDFLRFLDPSEDSEKKAETPARERARIELIGLSQEAFAAWRERLDGALCLGFFTEQRQSSDTVILFLVEAGQATACLVAARAGNRLIRYDAIHAIDPVPLDEASAHEDVLMPVFWSAVEPRLKDRFYREEDALQPIVSESGRCETEFVRLCKDVVAVANEASAGERYLLMGTLKGVAKVEYGSGLALAPWGRLLLDEIVRLYRPIAYVYHWNDGDPVRMSSYDVDPIDVFLEIEPTSALARADALLRLKAWYRETSDIDPSLRGRIDEALA